MAWSTHYNKAQMVSIPDTTCYCYYDFRKRYPAPHRSCRTAIELNRMRLHTQQYNTNSRVGERGGGLSQSHSCLAAG